MVTRHRILNDGSHVSYPHPYSRALECIEQRVDDTLLAALRRIANSIDPNWLSFSIELQPIEKAKGSGFPLDFTPTAASLNGPLRGDVDLLQHEDLQRPDLQQLLALRWVNDAMCGGQRGESCNHIKLYNDRHRIELIPGRTYICYEHWESGVVHSSNGDRFRLWLDTMSDPEGDRLTHPESLAHLTREMVFDRTNHRHPASESEYVDSSFFRFGSLHYLTKTVLTVPHLGDTDYGTW